MRPRLRRCFRRLGIGLALLALAAAAPIGWVETACHSPRAGDAGGVATALPIDDPGYRRPRARSYLSYPEWYIVHAYEDFAAVVRQTSESGFDYLSSIGGFWSSLCGASRVVSRAGEDDLETKVMLYIIGLSFTAEMAVKGLYERTVGQLTVWLRPGPTDEDRFALRLADDYARFLQQTPWYEYPFGAELARFWRETPLLGPGLVRKAVPVLGKGQVVAIRDQAPKRGQGLVPDRGPWTAPHRLGLEPAFAQGRLHPAVHARAPHRELARNLLP